MIFELCNTQTKNGKKHFKCVLHEIHPDNCVVDETGTLYNENGITYIEEYCKKQLDSIKDMSFTVEFLNEERTEIYGHGDTGCEDGLPIYEDATMIGHFTHGYITTIKLNGEEKRVCVGEGYLDYMRYKSFIDILCERLNNKDIPKGSVELTYKEGKEEIEYLYGYKDFGRIPKSFSYSGYSLLAKKPSDPTAILLELNNKREELNSMDNIQQVQTFVEEVRKIFSEVNRDTKTVQSENGKLKIELASKEQSIADKEAENVKLREDVKTKETKLSELEEKISNLKKELNECKKQNELNALETALSDFTEEEIALASKEIQEFKEGKTDIEVDSIVEKINAEIGKKIKAARATKKKEINSSLTHSDDIYGYVDDCSDDSTYDFDDMFSY